MSVPATCTLWLRVCACLSFMQLRCNANIVRLVVAEKIINMCLQNGSWVKSVVVVKASEQCLQWLKVTMATSLQFECCGDIVSGEWRTKLFWNLHLKPKTVVEWSCEAGEGFTWQSQVGANPIPIPHPTNLALFGHKITLYRFSQGTHTIAGGLKSEQGGWAPLPPHFNYWPKTVSE